MIEGLDTPLLVFDVLEPLGIAAVVLPASRDLGTT